MASNSLDKLRALQSGGVSSPPAGEDIKAGRIARACALNNAAMLASAFAQVFAATDACKSYTAEKVETLLRSIKNSEYAENLELLGVVKNDSDLPF